MTSLSFLPSVRDHLSGIYIFSPWPNLARSSPTKCLWVNGSYHNYRKISCQHLIFSPLGLIWPILHPQSALVKGCVMTFLYQGHIRPRKYNSENSYLPLSPLWLINHSSHRQRIWVKGVQGFDSNTGHSRSLLKDFKIHF